MLIDTHAHVNFNDFKNDFDAVIKRAQKKDIAMINVGSQMSTSQRAVQIAQDYEKVFASVGLHPIHLQNKTIKEEGIEFIAKAEKFEYASYLTLAYEDFVVAVGECGLDYFHIDNSQGSLIEHKELQKQIFIKQIQLANEADLPLIVHCRGSQENPNDAYLDILSIFKNHLPKKRGVIHCFLANWQIAEQFLELGFYLGVNGVVTFDKSGQLANIVTQCPLEQILLETDCPYLTPIPYRGQRNEPLFVEFVALEVAKIKQLSLEQVQAQTTQNAKNLFDLVV